MGKITSFSGTIQGRILVVDDERANIELLEDVLESHGHDVITAMSGAEALSKVSGNSTDAVLLDVMMPGLDGLEVCKRIKKSPQTAHLPVLLVTALRDRTDRLQGIQAGADDFISKPIDSDEVVLRIQNFVKTKNLFDEVQRRYAELRNLEQLRDNLTDMIIHDMSSPLMVINNVFELLSTNGNIQRKHFQSLVEKGSNQSGLLLEMIDSLLDVTRLENGQMPLKFVPCEVQEIVEQALSGFNEEVECHLPEETIIVRCDRRVMRRVIVNIVHNAVNYSPPEEHVVVKIEENSSHVNISIIDQGPGIPESYHQKIFEKFFRIDSNGKGRPSKGLGLTFCKMAMEAHGGQVALKSDVGKGCDFTLKLPKNQ